MEYKRLGRSGLQVSNLGLGTWMTFGNQLGIAGAKDIVQAALRQGINFFDTAEGYEGGVAETLLGLALQDVPRDEFVVATKIYWGGDGPNATGLSAKRVLEGSRASLDRLGLEHVDILFCHRHDPDTPLAETMRALDILMRRGQVLYWGTSEWPVAAIEEALAICDRLGVPRPIAEQSEYNLARRQRVEGELRALREDEGLGICGYAPLAGGLLTGKYGVKVPAGSRLAQAEELEGRMSAGLTRAIAELAPISERVGCTKAQLAMAWAMTSPFADSQLFGVTGDQQLEENLAALCVARTLEPAVRSQIEAAFAGVLGPVSS